MAKLKFGHFFLFSFLLPHAIPVGIQVATHIFIKKGETQAQLCILELGLLDCEEPRFITTIDANSWRQELALSAMKNPSFPRAFFFSFSIASGARRRVELEFDLARACS